MKKELCFIISAVLLLLFAGCQQLGDTPTPSAPEQPTTQDVPPALPGNAPPSGNDTVPTASDTSSPETDAAPAKLNISDLQDALSSIVPSAATLTRRGGAEGSYGAGSALSAENYLETLKCFTWEEYFPPAAWNRQDSYTLTLSAPGVTITAFQNGYRQSRPLHLRTDNGEGWFVLPYIQDETNGSAKQVSWMIYDTFDSWYAQAQTSAAYQNGGLPLTAKELDFFIQYTTSIWTKHDPEWGGFTGGATEISCFFTSTYSDPRDIIATDFLYYCPSPYTLEAADEEEFQLVQKKLDWRGGEDNHLLTLSEMPIPCHRLPRTYINDILSRYVGITIEEMNTDWKREAFYVPETDCFYSFSSDFGPGTFIPCYGEKNGDTVTLWANPHTSEGIADVLTLQKNGDSWHILSHLPAPN